MRKLEKDKLIAQEEKRRAKDELQKTNEGENKIDDKVGTGKEGENMQV